ncbi:MAG: DUF2189 domain-containing protein [Geminicoccaceae bacterium]|nr:DUF2189 domain-containing protein [Geminicoccaceae bacterium]
MATTVSSGPMTAVRRVDTDRPWVWLERGWADMRANPVPSVAFGLLLALAGWLLTFGLFWLGMGYLILPLAGGFFILAPALATSLYEISRERAKGREIGLIEATAIAFRGHSQILLMGVVLLLCHIAWAQIASLTFMLYFGADPPPLQNLFAATFLDPANLAFTVFGTGLGAILAFGVFSISAIGIPMLLDRGDASVADAILTSMEAVRVNPAAMLLWAALIAGFTAGGLALFYLGLAVTLPLVAHATWHAYADLTKGDPG